MPEQSNGEPTSQQDPTKELKREFHIFEKISLVINVVLALTGIGVLCIYSGQLAVMQGTLDEMRRSGQGTTDQTNSLIGNMNWLARTMQESLRQNREAAHSSETRSREALDASVKASRTEQRAWINVTLHAKPDFTAKLLMGTFRMVNAGKTPALNVRGFVFMHLLRRNQLPDFSFVPNEENPGPIPHWHAAIRNHSMFPNPTGETISLGVIDPLAIQPTDTRVMRTVAVTPELIRDLTDGANGRLWIGIHGRIDYQDIFDVWHWITFCWDGMEETMFADLEVRRACLDHNNTDKPN
jgi:hypothetical protein